MMRDSLLVVAISAALISGCSTEVSYGDAKETETVTVDYGSTDLQTLSSKMVQSLIESPATSEMGAKGRPVLFVDSIRNKSSEHIDTEALTDTMRTQLLRSGKYRFVDMTKVQAVKEQLEYQQQSGMVDPAAMVRLGKQTGAQYMLYGNLASIVKDNGKVKDVFYQLTMNLMDLQSGELVWADQQEIRKQRTKKTLGW
ncbi:MAG: penicillin-binding protein activator LpoB [Aeromonadaceae bacterium]